LAFDDDEDGLSVVCAIFNIPSLILVGELGVALVGGRCCRVPFAASPTENEFLELFDELVVVVMGGGLLVDID